MTEIQTGARQENWRRGGRDGNRRGSGGGWRYQNAWGGDGGPIGTHKDPINVDEENHSSLSFRGGESRVEVNTLADPKPDRMAAAAAWAPKAAAGVRNTSKAKA